MILDNAYFTFDGKIYSQKWGIPMGSSLGPVIANLVIDFLFEGTFSKLPYKPPFLFKYIDDIITAIPENKIQATIDVLNDFNEKIKFTKEIEQDGEISFLDLRLIRDGENIKTKWIRKRCKSTRVVNYHSNHPLIHKRNLVYNMILRADRLSNPEYKQDCFTEIKKIMFINKYPRYFIEKIFKLYFFKNRQPTLNSISVIPDGSIGGDNNSMVNSKIYMSLTYTPGLSERIKKLISRVSDSIIISFKPINTLSFLFNNKDPTPLLKNSEIVYKVSCNDCDLCYVGQTRQYLNSRLSQHKSNIKNRDTSVALADHTINNNHHFNFEDVKILGFEDNYYKRLTLEAIYIYLNNTVNFKQDIRSTIFLYRNILKR